MAKNQTIQHKRSSVAGNIPTPLQVAKGELAINFADKSIYTQDASGNIIELARDVIKSATAPSAPVDGTLWYDTTNTQLKFYNGTVWANILYSGPTVLPTNTTSSTPVTGSGTSGSPYLITTSVVSGATQTISTFTITGLAAKQFVPIFDMASVANGGRFSVDNNIADDTGNLVFTVTFTDSPATANGTTYTAQLKVGTATVYINIAATIGSPFPQTLNSPVNTTSMSTIWSSPNDTLTATGSISISTDNVTFTQASTAIINGATLYLKWTGAAGSGLGIDGTSGTTITGTVVASAGGVSSHLLTIDKTVTAYSFTAVTGASLSTATNSASITLAGINSYVYLTSANTMKASVGGGSFTTVPASGTTLSAINGQSLQVQQTSSASSSTTTTVTLSVNGVTGAFAVTTAAPGTINTPTIETPVNNSTGISLTATITSSAYSVTGAVGTHLNSDWELYSDSGLTTLVTSSIASTTNKTTWTPTGLTRGTQYWVRVRYRSNDGTPVVSSYSAASTYTTTTLFYYPLRNSATDPTNPASAIRTTAGYNFVANDGIYTTSAITTMNTAFYNNAAFNDPDVALWDVSTVTSLRFAFYGCSAFNQPLNSWDVSNVDVITSMFKGCTVFNQPLNSWNVSNVTAVSGLNSMFYDCLAFNQSLNSWDVSNITTFDSTFYGCTVYNQPMNSWDVSNATYMPQMFAFCSAFNQPLNSWNVSLVTNTGMNSMFSNATSFNQDLTSWVTGLTAQPTGFSTSANATWVAAKATKFPYLQDGVTRINT